RRGLPRSTLMQLLAERCGVRNRNRPPPLTIEQILAWADSYHARTGIWPEANSGPIPEAEPETWNAVAHALQEGFRGLPAGSSLARLLAQHRGHRNRADLPDLSEEQILAWADSYHKRHGRWPTEPAGLIPRSGGETWSGVDQALRVGLRGLPAGSSLARLL